MVSGEHRLDEKDHQRPVSIRLLTSFESVTSISEPRAKVVDFRPSWRVCLRDIGQWGYGMLVDEQWPVARLIPISSASGVEAQERRASSALLAVVAAVPEFAHALLKPLGAPKGKVQTFIEVPFKFNGRSIRPDGIISVTRGGKSWGAIVETKVGASPLEREQMDLYLDLARELQFNAVLSLSNFSTRSTWTRGS